MNWLMLLAAAGLIYHLAYRQGKRIGSRKGFHAGRSRRRRR